ncbi:MAG: hypothetical protein JJU02_08505 [Cryomorphaceae bacterium]|nr:hypothetical protein [Cryomorphaceae bacterium]
MRQKNILLALLVFCTFSEVEAQPYIEGGKTRHRFAQLTLGTDFRRFHSGDAHTYMIDDLGLMQQSPLNPHLENRIIIGGTHFWGHADFFIAIPFTSFGNSGFSTGVETGAKYFPLAIERNKIRPYVGVSMVSNRYKQGEGAEVNRFRYPAKVGVVYGYRDFLFDLGMGYQFQNTIPYYINTTQMVKVKTQTLWFSIGLTFMLDNTLNAEEEWLSGRTQRVTEILAERKRLNGFSIGAGFSSTFFLKPASHNASEMPFIDQHSSAVFPEFGLGYYWHKPDVHINLAYRKIESTISAFEHLQTARRNAITLEGFWFFADYQGFAPFIGPAISFESQKVIETYPDGRGQGGFSGFKPGLIFGWDIRPNRIQTWYLRTNLRYFPAMDVAMPSGKSFSFDQLEFNFIQLVVFPERFF